MKAAMRKMHLRTARGVAGVFLLIASAGCGSKSSTALEPCDTECKDGIALRAVRETMRFVYNQKLQGKPVGAQDAGADCLMTGTAQVFGTGTSNPEQGATEVHLTYVFNECLFTVPKNPTRERNYAMTITGAVTEDGILAVQPSSTTSLKLVSQALSLTGTVSDPPIDYDETICMLTDAMMTTDAMPRRLDAAQNGNNVAGTLCGRTASFTGFSN
jgi:hypothetical protein